LMALLHSRAMIIGDVSMRNVLWTGTDGQPVTIFLIDCDGIRMLGQVPVMAQAETPDWEDPNQPKTGPDLDTDRYKLALLVGRVLCCRAYIRPQDDALTLPSDLPDRMVTRVETLWKQAASPYGQRPDATQWLQAFANRDEILLPTLGPVRDRYPTGVGLADLHPSGNTPRPSIAVTPPTPRPAPQVPAPEVPRPSIPLWPPAPPKPLHPKWCRNRCGYDRPDAGRRLVGYQPVPRKWFPADLAGVAVLCLASAGGNRGRYSRRRSRP
jgi:hypothetical protein